VRRKADHYVGLGPGWGAVILSARMCTFAADLILVVHGGVAALAECVLSWDGSGRV
jgi:hypothetical protein